MKYEEYKLKLDEETQKIRDELNRLESEYKQKLRSNDNKDWNDLRNAKETAQKELNSYLNALNELKFDENKWKRIEQQCNMNIGFLEQK